MNKTIHFFDLDRTLWSIDTKPWIINKNNPSKPIIRLTKEESLYILSGIYKNEELKIEYNGSEFWISEEILEKIQKKRKLEITDLGLSFTEYINPDYFTNVKYLIENIRHVGNEDNVDIGILSSRYSVDNDDNLLKILVDKLSELGLEINKFYYTGDKFTNGNNTKINTDKMKILLEHMTGFHIEGNHFAPIKQNFYKNVHYYDDEPQNINVANDTQSFLEEYLKKTDDEVFERISKRIGGQKPKLYTHLITNNQLNRFKTTKIELVQPIKFSIKLDERRIIKGFNDFNK